MRDVKIPSAHPYIAVFELVRPFNRRMMPWKFCDDISNGSGVIVVTDKLTNGRYWQQYGPRCMDGKIIEVFGLKQLFPLHQGLANFWGSRAGWAHRELAAGRTGKFYVKNLITVD